MRTRSIVCWFIWMISVLLPAAMVVSPATAGEGASVKITSPKYDSVHVAGDSIVFACSVKSAAGVEMPKVKMVWSSQLDGKIGEGALLKVDSLTLGIHRITVEAYDESGANLGTDSIKLKVSQTKETDGDANSGVAPIGVGKGEPYVVNPFN